MMQTDSSTDPIIHIASLSHDARGVGRVEGKAVFVRDALPDERVTYNVYKKHSQYDEADVVSIIEPSAERVGPKCSYFGYCGGCALQHLDASRQIHYKQQWLADQLYKFAHCEPSEWAEPLTGPYWQYRYKARLGVKYVKAKGRVLVGFREKKGRYLADIERCEILHPKVGDNLLTLSDMIGQLTLYNQCPQIEVAATDDQVALNFRLLAEPTEADLQILAEYGSAHGFAIYIQRKGPLTTYLHYAPEGFEQLSYLADDTVRLSFAPYQFTQINPMMNREMIAQAIDWMDLSEEDSILDLFCGIGNFSLPIATKVDLLVGVEGDATAIDSARENADANAVTNTTFHVSDLFEDQSHQGWMKQSFNKVILDPPRSGAEMMANALCKMLRPEMILYVSCNPSTLARDIAILTEGGYQLQKANVMDMFPHTAHVESMALLTRK